MAESTEMKAGDNPADYNVDQVNAYLATADDAERQRVLDAEASEDGKGRSTIQAPASTGNPNDLAERPADSSVSAEIAHQEGAPAELAKAADEATEKGYMGETAAKPDYSQSNPAVMNQDG